VFGAAEKSGALTTPTLEKIKEARSSAWRKSQIRRLRSVGGHRTVPRCHYGGNVITDVADILAIVKWYRDLLSADPNIDAASLIRNQVGADAEPLDTITRFLVGFVVAPERSDSLTG
jgi:hypothetical protein